MTKANTPIKIKNQHLQSDSSLLGEYETELATFPDLNILFAKFESSDFKSRSTRKRFRFINEQLLRLILDAPKESFLLSAVLNFIEEVNQRHLLREPYRFSLFEFFLNHFADLSPEQNYEVRGKIAGKQIPRDDYQSFFPIGMNKIFSGTHFVAAHLSPDVDTMIASFWGWLDAFAAKVGDGQHIWSLPGGPPNSPVSQLLRKMVGDSLFSTVSDTSETLTLAAIDLVSQKNLLKKDGETSTNTFEPGFSQRAIILVDENGHYLGDWHSSDAEVVRQIIVRFKSCLHWFENNLHVKLISLLAKKDLDIKDFPAFLSSIFQVLIADCEPVKDFDEKQQKDLNDFLIKVIGMKNGLKGSFEELNKSLAALSVPHLSHFQFELESLQNSDLFDKAGKLREERPIIFYHLEKIIHQLNHAIHNVRDYAERLDVAISIKHKVLNMPQQFVTMRNDVEDIRIKIKNYEYLTVVIPEQSGKFFPVGIVWANDLRKSTLGTVSFRDFCNQDEVKMASYLSPISVIDHHKTSFKTISTPCAIVGDAQSCNVLIAEQAFKINDRYSLGGMTPSDIETQLMNLHKYPLTPSSARILQKLFLKKMAVDSAGKSFVHPTREFTEYLSFLQAILDDTDLLTKVSKRDVECVVELLNRMKTLSLKKEVEIIQLDNIAKDKNFAKSAAKQILRHPDMYSLYQQIYAIKEHEIEESFIHPVDKNYSSVFLDTKEQNGCCRVGQTKIFSSNFSTFLEIEPKLIEVWQKMAEKAHNEQHEIDLHLHMISTIASAKEVYENNIGNYHHKDALWFWVPRTQKAYDHLSSFLNAFQNAPELHGNKLELEFMAPGMEDCQQIFANNFPIVTQRKINTTTTPVPIVILRYNAGTINSRKAMISPYLPRILY